MVEIHEGSGHADITNGKVPTNERVRLAQLPFQIIEDLRHIFFERLFDECFIRLLCE